MRKTLTLAILLTAMLFAAPVLAQEEAKDITKEVLVGPGSISVSTDKDILMSFGALVRIIPTAESNWDFGMSKSNPRFLGGALNNSFFYNHVNESGWVNNSYIRNEDKIYFNALPKNRKWSFYSALEFDRALETATVDERGGKTDDTSDFGLERLHVSMELPYEMRLHAGWDIWGLDLDEGAGLVYADDNPGIWLTGGQGPLAFNLGYFKLREYNFQNSTTNLANLKDADRDLYAGYLSYKLREADKLQFFYALDRIRSVPATDFLGYLMRSPASTPETDSHHLGAYYIGRFGALEVFGEGVYQFGRAGNTGLTQDDFDIRAYALAGDLAYELKDLVGFGLKPHVGIMYTSGDDKASDDKLGGYQGVENIQRFSSRWGGENTIVGDTNLVFGSLLYGYIPELYGNGTPVFTGGLQNTAGMGGGRGDNPGLTMTSVGLTATPKKFLIYKTNINSFWFNEDMAVSNFVNPALGTTAVGSGYAGTEWDNELTLALSPNTFIKGQAAFFFPGQVIEDLTQALSGTRSDDMASRLAMELIWKF